MCQNLLFKRRYSKLKILTMANYYNKTKFLWIICNVKYLENGEQRSTIVYLIDYKNVDNNSYIVANQWTFVENSEKRPDVLLFINGLPLVLFELKSPSREETDSSQAYRQIRNYILLKKHKTHYKQ